MSILRAPRACERRDRSANAKAEIRTAPVAERGWPGPAIRSVQRETTLLQLCSRASRAECARRRRREAGRIRRRNAAFLPGPLRHGDQPARDLFGGGLSPAGRDVCPRQDRAIAARVLPIRRDLRELPLSLRAILRPAGSLRFGV